MEYNLLSDLIHCRAKVFGDEEALKIRDKATKIWSSVSWNTFSERIMQTAYAMCNWGIRETSNIGVYTQNMAECLYIDFAAFANRAVTAPMYATASLSQIKYIVDEAEIELIFAGEQFQYDNAFRAQKECPTLKQIIILDKTVIKASGDNTSQYFEDFISGKDTLETTVQTVKKRMNEVKEDDIVHLIYTSGTTGEPKGVILKQSNYVQAMKIHDIRLSYLPQRFTSMCFLPLTHIFEKAWSIFCLHKGCTLAINQDPREIQTTIKEVRPDAMCCVPRFWEKVYAGVQDKINNSGWITKKILLDAIKTGYKHNLNYVNLNKRAPWWLRTKFGFYEKTIYNLLKKTVGIEKGVIFPCAGAALSDNINTFIQSANIPLIYGYGLTETTATVTCFTSTGFEIGTVGVKMPETEIKIGENDEILIKGKTIMHGYYKKPRETAEAFTEDGWFRTGDAGRFSEKGGLILTDRIKDLYKTSNGKYIAPQQIEIKLCEDKYIDMAAVIGNERKYVTALIIPVYEELESYAKENNIIYNNREELCNNPQIYKMLETRINGLLKDQFATYEQIKRFTVLDKPFSIETGELTNTLKVKRNFIGEQYKNQIDKMYL